MARISLSPLSQIANPIECERHETSNDTLVRASMAEDLMASTAITGGAIRLATARSHGNSLRRSSSNPMPRGLLEVSRARQFNGYIPSALNGRAFWGRTMSMFVSFEKPANTFSTSADRDNRGESSVARTGRVKGCD